mgnify:CR=1 FL=1
MAAPALDDRRRILMVTGGSRGIGAACARLAAAAGYGIPGIVFREAADVWKVIRENCV